MKCSHCMCKNRAKLSGCQQIKDQTSLKQDTQLHSTALVGGWFKNGSDK